MLAVPPPLPDIKRLGTTQMSDHAITMAPARRNDSGRFNVMVARK